MTKTQVKHPFTGKLFSPRSEVGKRILAYTKGTGARGLCSQTDLSGCSPGQKCGKRLGTCYTPKRLRRGSVKQISGSYPYHFAGGRCPSGYVVSRKGRCKKSRRKSGSPKKRRSSRSSRGSASPMKKRRSYRKRKSGSPKKRSGRKRRSGSPKKRRSTKKRSGSPKKRRSTKKRSGSPKKRRSPMKKRSGSPKKRRSPTKKRSGSPKKRRSYRKRKSSKSRACGYMHM